ncbi:glycosyltransferase family 4 protein [Pseudoxanthomonas sp. UTMC 1351]|uniref:glycosyltransferase family 4 protein n=1 Tax=Pseudoxanthomonas sp. UTMC 1351 TaxID=2695853 RepID=UPI0034CF16BA
MHVAQINLVSAPAFHAPTEVFRRWPSLADIAEAVACAGAQVSVIQASPVPATFTRSGIDYHFIDPSKGMAQLAGKLRDIRADVLHVHGLEFARAAHAIKRLLPHMPILLQDHANQPPRWWRRIPWRRWYASAAGIAFTSLEMAQPFLQAELFAPSTRLFAIPESSSRFTPGDRTQARHDTGLDGDPCVLWVGHLSPGKDPLCVLEGVTRAVLQLPGLRLWCAFNDAPLLAQVQRCIESDPRLAGRVGLLGKVEHARVETLMRAADIFVAGSLRESCGYAALEAFACGAMPVLTDIPAFRALTDGGRVGELWPCGDPDALAAALIRAAAERPSPAELRAHFDERLSFAAVGQRWANAYLEVCE